MIDVLEHPLVANYLRDLDVALAGLPAAAAAELSEQLRAHLLDNALPLPDPALRSRSSARGPAPDQLVWLSAGYRVLRRPEEVTMARANDEPMSAAR
jgi:hypothetical protein